MTGGPFNYHDVGITRPADRVWRPIPTRGRQHETTARLGSGEGLWDRASVAVMQWAVKTRSGFSVYPADTSALAGRDYRLTAGIGPFRVNEPVRVVDVVQESDRVGFSYGTLAGHPVAGEEAFVVLREGDDVLLTLRSVTAAGVGIWRLSFPLVLVAQRIYRRRYLRALVDDGRD